MDLVFWCSWCNSYSLYKKAGVYFEWYSFSFNFSLFLKVSLVCFCLWFLQMYFEICWTFHSHFTLLSLRCYHTIALCAPPPSPQPLCWEGGGSWTSNQLFIKGVLDRTSTFRGGCWERGRGDFFQEGCWLQFSHTQKN